jgi:hypothetical protein
LVFEAASRPAFERNKKGTARGSIPEDHGDQHIVSLLAWQIGVSCYENPSWPLRIAVCLSTTLDNFITKFTEYDLDLYSRWYTCIYKIKEIRRDLQWSATAGQSVGEHNGSKKPNTSKERTQWRT